MKHADPDSILSRLRSQYDLSQSRDEFLHFRNPYETLIATILSAQTTDRCVNKVTKELFSRYPDCAALAQADIRDVERIIHPTGFYHAKARHIIAASQMVMTEFQGRVPDEMEDLIRLPGVGRKTANIVLDHAFSKTAGIAVDTHVRRVSMRLGITDESDPDRIETDLVSFFPQDSWAEVNGLFILHGRRVCTARRPACDQCVLFDLCRYASTG
ncbi:MAG TPA: endonuclease III [Methanospirillum sp.]|uniref:endonuclease III n=1 Tax=Methanospirillum sp. TaxID=45200 RepID=UPI002C4101E7|nr:endonuclease III [Methanospirillum sp.]HOJ96534.1 endonuclease III [Methanospirillum sp.]HPP77600.1 endonuclease III [Methanospirillum sp.]